MKSHIRLVIKVILVMIMILAMITMSLVGMSQSHNGETDTIIERRVTYRLFPGAIYDTTFVFTLPKPKPIVIAKTDTITIHDTLYINCPPIPKKEIKWSDFVGTFQQFIDSASRSKSKAVVDKEVILKETIKLPNISIVGRGGYITSTAYTVFELLPTKQLVDSLPIFASATTWYTFLRKPITNALYADSISNCAIIGGRFGYMSSQGGSKDSLCVTAMHNTSFHTSFVGIHIYSQDGPYRALHLTSVYTKADSGHNIYTHPNVSIKFDSVVTENFPYKKPDGSWHSANALQYFSAGSGEVMEGTQKYFSIRRCRSIKVNGYTGMWTILGPKNIPAIIEDCEIAPYNVWQRVYVKNSKLINAGQGVVINGTIENCTGEVWSGGGLTTVNGGTFDYATARVGGTMVFNAAIVSLFDIADRGNAFNVAVNSSVISRINDGKNGAGTITFYNSPIPPNNCRDGIIKQVEVK